MRVLSIVFLIGTIHMHIMGDFGINDYKDRKDCLLSIISNTRSNFEEKASAQLELAGMYLYDETLQNFPEAQQIYINIIENKKVKSETKNKAKLKLAHIFAGMCESDNSSICPNYFQAIQLYNEVIADSTFDRELKRWAQYYLAGLYIGKFGTLPLLEVSRAKELLLQMVGNAATGNDELHSMAQLLLAKILSGAYSYPIPFLVDKEPCDFKQAIILYNAVIDSRYADKTDRTEAHWQLLQLYLNGPADIYSPDKAVKHSKYLLENNSGYSLFDQWTVKVYIAKVAMFKKNATKEEVQQAIMAYHELLKDSCINERYRENLLFELNQFQKQLL